MAYLPLTRMRLEDKRGRRRHRESLGPVAFASGQSLALDLHRASNATNHARIGSTNGES